MTLDFQECYAKIRQVDSYATLGDGVVVQVSNQHGSHLVLKFRRNVGKWKNLSSGS